MARTKAAARRVFGVAKVIPSPEGGNMRYGMLLFLLLRGDVVVVGQRSHGAAEVNGTGCGGA
jgi:hypothetical protein